MSKSSRRDRFREKQPAARPPEPEPEPTPPTPVSPPAAPQPSAPAAAPKPRAAPPPSRQAACYVDFENLFFSAAEHHQALSVPRIVRHLNRLSRGVSGIGWVHTAVYANWDAIIPQARHAQDDWAMLGWRTVAVPSREDYVSQRTVKNLADFVMSLDMLEDARDRAWDHFFIVSGDKDFCEVAERLKRLRRHVTVVALKPNLSWRLREAADDYVVWSLEEITGDEPLPMQSYRRLTQAVATPGREHAEDPFQVLLRAVRLAERDQGVAPVSWRLVRDEYFLRMSPMSEADADKFVRTLSDAGFVNLVSRRMRDGGSQAFVSVPR